MSKLMWSVGIVMCALGTYAGFWDAINKVQKTVDTVNAVGNLINGKTPTPSQQPAVQTPASVQKVRQTATTMQSPQNIAKEQMSSIAITQVSDSEISSFASATTTAVDATEPKYAYGQIYFKKPATPAQVAAAKAKLLADKRKLDSVVLNFEGVDDATFAAACGAFPLASRINLNKCPALTDVSALSIMRNVKEMSLRNVSKLDVTPLSGMVLLRKLDLGYSNIPDLAPIGMLPNLTEIEFYGSVLNSFTPLAGCPRLERVYFYAAKLPEDGYATLGLLKQVKKFHGGLTKMTSLEWLRQVPQAEELEIFSEKIHDLTPISSATNLKYLRIWNFCDDHMAPALGDLSLIANLANLEKLELPGCKYSNVAVIGGLSKIRELKLSGTVSDIDLSFLSKLKSLEVLDVSKPKGSISNFDVVFSCCGLKKVDIQGVNNISSISGFSNCDALESVTVSKGKFPESEINALNAKLKSRKSWYKVREY